MFGMYKSYNAKLAMTTALFIFFLFLFFELVVIENFLFLPIILVFAFLTIYFISSVLIDIILTLRKKGKEKNK